MDTYEHIINILVESEQDNIDALRKCIPDTKRKETLETRSLHTNSSELFYCLVDNKTK
jgi:hypothetical protein